MGLNDHILLSGGYDDGDPDNGQRCHPAHDKVDRPGKPFMEIPPMCGQTLGLFGQQPVFVVPCMMSSFVFVPTTPAVLPGSH
jgi:hypothetical protein